MCVFNLQILLMKLHSYMYIKSNVDRDDVHANPKPSKLMHTCIYSGLCRTHVYIHYIRVHTSICLNLKETRKRIQPHINQHVLAQVPRTTCEVFTLDRRLAKRPRT